MGNRYLRHQQVLISIHIDVMPSVDHLPAPFKSTTSLHYRTNIRVYMHKIPQSGTELTGKKLARDQTIY